MRKFMSFLHIVTSFVALGFLGVSTSMAIGSANYSATDYLIFAIATGTAAALFAEMSKER
jgi:hypothetical protein